MNRMIQQLGSAPDNFPLICFPFAGGYSASFRPLHAYLKDVCNLVAIEPPGHGSNRMPLVESLEQLVDMYLRQLLARLGEPFVMFGHSMGGMIVYRLTQKLEQLGIFPKAVIISAVQPPHISREPMSQLDDEAFLDYVLGLGGIPSELAKEREILQFFMPSFRADFKALETFKHTDYTLLRTPVHIFNGEQDTKCMKDALGWNKWAHRASFHTFRGGHMFLMSEVEAVAQAIQSVASLESAKELVRV